MMKSFFSALFLLIFSFSSSVAVSEIMDGRYLGAGSDSDIVIETDGEGRQRFLMNVLGANGHMCVDVAGTIIGNQGLVDDEEDLGLGVCELDFQQNRHILDITAKDYEGCRQYCGMRATLEGSYRMPPQNCTFNAMTAQRYEFKKLYDEKQYGDAEAILNRLLSQCDFYLDFVQRDAIRNDLALTLYHQGEPQRCLEVLSSAVTMDPNIYLPPLEQEMYEDTEKAIRFNWGLCGG